MKQRQKRLRLIIGVAIVVVAVIGSDTLARKWIQSGIAESDYAYRIQRPAAYQNSPYWSPAFIDEQIAVDATWDLGIPGFDRATFSGQWYHVTDGIRRTVGQPVNATRTVYLFGSSTVLDAEVPDEYTIASVLQHRLGNRYRVENLGAAGYTIWQQYLRLQQTPIKPGDVVIFYDGATEAAVIWSKAYSIRKETVGCKTGAAIITALFCSGPPPIDDSYFAHEMIDYRDYLSKSQAFASAHGAAFYHFLQPQLWSRPLTATESALSPVIPDWAQGVMTKLWPLMEALPDTIDLTHILDAVRNQQAIYLDYDHVNEVADAIIAEAIYNAAFPVL